MVEAPPDNRYVRDPDLDFPPPEDLTEGEAEAEAETLREAIEYHDYRYYVLGDPVIADRAYDRLFDRLQTLESRFDLDRENSPTQRVGGQPVDSLDTVEHVAPMLSLESSEQRADVREWDRRVRDAVGGVEYSVEPKFDGVSVELVYDDGSFDRAVTRGDGERGDDISHTVRTIGSVPLHLRDGPDRLSVRAEVYMPRSAFQTLNEERVTRGEEPFANPRNATAGTVRQLDPSVVADRPLAVYCYDVLATSASLASQRDAVGLMREVGLRVWEDIAFVRDVDDVIAYRETLLEQRDDLEVEIDGIVAKVSDFDIRDQLGSTARHPRWAFAFKFPARQGETVVRRIVVQVGRTGKLTPVALLDPVDVGGVTISRATLHNAGVVEELGVAEGATVSIERAGDVIPEIASVLDGPESSFEMPDRCPVCGSDVRREGEYHFCTGGTTCPAQLRRSIQHYCSREAMDIQGVGETLASQLVDEELVESIADLYSLTVEDLLPLDSMGEKSARKLIGEIEERKDVRLDRFIYALGIRHVGRERARALANAFTVDELMDAAVDDLVRCEDIGPEVAESVRSFFENQQNRETIERILSAGVSPRAIATTDELAGISVVFTGSIEGYTRAELTDLLERHGATVTGSVSGETDVLVVGDDPGQTKLDDARTLGVETVDSDEFRTRFLDQVTGE